MPSVIEKLNANLQRRLAFIDFYAYYTGIISGRDLTERFSLSKPQATRTFAQYKDLCPNNLVYDTRLAAYIPSKDFQSLLKPLSPGEVLNIYSGQLIPTLDKESGYLPGQMRTDISIIQPRACPISILLPLLRSLHLQKVVTIHYRSASSGYRQRDIVPGALASDGSRWHLRAFDRHHQRFADFVLSRCEKAEINELAQIETVEQLETDTAWNTMVDLILTPHPKINKAQQEAVMLEYQMHEKVRVYTVRQALAGYFLNYKNVDCSPDASLNPSVYRLWLKNREEVETIDNMLLVAGF